MRRFLLPTALSLVMTLSACAFRSSPTPIPEASSSSSSESTQLITHNVSYTGTINDFGDTPYQQGTHKLLLENGDFLLLESTDSNLNLSTYLGRRVEVHGSLQPSVETSGMILKAEEVIVLDEYASSTSESATSKAMCGGIAGILCENGQSCVDDPSDSCDPHTGGADCSGICVSTLQESSSSSSMPSSVMTVSSSQSSANPVAVSSSSSTSSAVSSQSSLPDNSAALEQQIVLLAKQTYDQDSLWTQKYCTSHIAFCIPVHKNWYFKSFGATTSNRWHVEFGMVDIEGLGDGAIIVNIVSGSSASMQAQDGQVKSQGTDVIGFKDWTDNTHFEIIADARLKPAVSYMLSHITPYAGGQ